ncbi:MAG TPA: L-2-hydroxyglutarate oxidase, partial [Saprospiraceae bacterium]|nr:L-2-hydroxyglutarate oxidase [Saprospiraceae bacterium]
MRQFDVIIVGAGIVGLATGLSLLKRRPELKVCILEKERDIAQHQTGHNSGVIHSGIYYKPGSLKATNCLNGYKMLLDFCVANEVPYELCGKVIVATSEAELPVLDNIFKRGASNGLSGLKKISAEEVREIEPHVRCVAGIRVPQTGIVDYKIVAEKYRQLFEQTGGEVLLNEEVKDIFTKNKITTVVSGRQEFLTKLVVNCAGLYSDKISRMTMPDIRLQIVPFRGEYYMLKKEKQQLVRHLIYPVPNPDFPFLGVHFTRMIGGGVEAGPNAVLAFRREGYTNHDVHWGELWQTLRFAGFRKVARKYWREGWGEMYR